MARQIDIASFTCPKCGHRSTPPDAVNAIPHQMEKYEMILDKQSVEKLKDKKEQAKLAADLGKKHSGNEFAVDCIENIPGNRDKKVVRCKRSYSKIKEQSHTDLAESNHIVLGCPQCDTTLYEVRWSK